MKASNVLIKPHFEVCICNDVKFSALNQLLSDVEPLYPNFDSWMNFTFRRNINSGERSVLIAHNGDQLLGALLLKMTYDEHKICTFYVHPQYRGLYLGSKLMDLALLTLDSDDVYITVSEERNRELSPLLLSKGFQLSNSINSLYRKGKIEYFYTL